LRKVDLKVGVKIIVANGTYKGEVGIIRKILDKHTPMNCRAIVSINKKLVTISDGSLQLDTKFNRKKFHI
jgi:hypothetical protein